MKKRTIFFVLLLFTSLATRAGAYNGSVQAEAAIVYEPETEAVLFEKRADERMLVASTTKIMTALVVLENCKLADMVDIKQEYTRVEGSSMYLKAGEEYSVCDLLYGMMLASGNDAATALACHTAGSMEAFAALMNEKCAVLGLQNTHFVNSHGLDAPEHYSSARDLARITACAMENADFREIFKTQRYTVDGVSYVNHNKLLNSCNGCTGGKTGYTEAAGRILVSSAQRGDTQLICVTISDPDDWNDHRALYDWAFGAYRYMPTLDDRARRIEVISGTMPYVELTPARPGLLVATGSAVSKRMYLPTFLFAPVTAGDRAGEVCFYVDGEQTVIPVVYANSVLIDGSVPLTPLERFKRAWFLSCKYGTYYMNN